MPPSPDSPPYVPPPTFIDDPDRDDPGSANHLLQGIWETSSGTDHFAFEIEIDRSTLGAASRLRGPDNQLVSVLGQRIFLDRLLALPPPIYTQVMDIIEI